MALTPQQEFALLYGRDTWREDREVVKQAPPPPRERKPRPSRARSTGKPRPKAPSQKPAKERAKTPAPRPPKYSRERIAALYQEGNSVTEIAKILGAHRATVNTALTEAGIPVEQRTYAHGPGPRKLCGKGLHDMDVHGRPVKSGGRYCSACKADREREAWQRKKARIHAEKEQV